MRFSLHLGQNKNQTRPKIEIMEAQINNTSVSKEIQVYKNDFYSGIVMLIKKLFML